jgi:threonine/homoserine efflux transporter RhtA
MVLTLVAAAVVCGLDLLAAGNAYERFYWLVGLEFLLFAVAIWVVYIVRKVRES